MGVHFPVRNRPCLGCPVYHLPQNKGRKELKMTDHKFTDEIAKYNLTNTQIREYIDKRYKSEKYRNILKERIIDGRKLNYLAIKYYGEDNSPNKILLLERKISKMTHNFALWLEKERRVVAEKGEKR
jgi:hypothetical protein